MKLSEKKLFMLDMDGTIYLDSTLFDGTLDFLAEVRRRGGKYLFLTNNSSRGTDAYVEKLKHIGIDATADDFLTSTDATIAYLKSNYPGRKIYALGTRSFVAQLRESGIDVTEEMGVDVYGIVISNDIELTFKKLDDVCRMLSDREMLYIATNPDWVCPTAYGYVPDCGSFAEMIYRATGKRPKFIGKPEPEMLLMALKKYGYEKCEAVMIGDRVYTDIASGYNAGVDTVFVLSGEGTRLDAEKSDTPPTYIMESIKDVLNSIIGTKNEAENRGRE